MKKWLKALVLVLAAGVAVAILGFVVIVHIPYQNNQARLNSIKDNIVAANQYEYNDYFNEYQGDDLYYILNVIEDGEPIYVVINDDNELVAKRTMGNSDEDSVAQAFYDQYGVQADSLEIGYENSTMVYALKYVGEEELIYAYYNLNTGVLTKAYIL